MTTLRRILAQSAADALSTTSPSPVSGGEGKEATANAALKEGIAAAAANAGAERAAKQRTPRKKRSDSRASTGSSKGKPPRRGHNSGDANDYVCGVCEQPGDLLLCDGPCLRSFHLRCLKLPRAPPSSWVCDDCRTDTHECFLCGEKSSHTKKCQVPSCGKFYHMSCVREQPRTRLQNDSFSCPIHKCCKCRETVRTRDVVRCIKCPRSFHAEHVPADDSLYQILKRRFKCRAHYSAADWAALPSDTAGSAINDARRHGLGVRGVKRARTPSEAGSVTDAAGGSRRRSTPRKDSRSTPRKDGRHTPRKDGRHTPRKDGRNTPRKDGRSSNHGAVARPAHAPEPSQPAEMSGSLPAGGEARATNGATGTPDPESAAGGGDANGTVTAAATQPAGDTGGDRAATAATTDPSPRPHKRPRSPDEAGAGAAAATSPEVAAAVTPAPAPAAASGGSAPPAVLLDDDDDDEEANVDMRGTGATDGDAKPAEPPPIAVASTTEPAVKKRRTASGDAAAPSQAASISQAAPTPNPTPSSAAGAPAGAVVVVVQPTATTAEAQGVAGGGRQGASQDDVPTAPPPVGEASRSLSIGIPVERARAGSSGTPGGRSPAARKRSHSKAGTPRKGSSSTSAKPEKQRSPRADAKAPPLQAEPVEVEGSINWVQCDKCKKWRMLPNEVDASKLPENWFCEMNRWDPRADNCTKPEIQYIVKNATADTTAGAKPANTKPTVTPKPRNNHGVKRSRSRERKTGKAKTPSRTRPRLSRTATETPINYKETGTPVGPVATATPVPSPTATAAPKRKAKPKVQWVQCDKCAKWRSIPNTVDADKLPEKWFCRMNKWDKVHNSCEAPEEDTSTTTPARSSTPGAASTSKKSRKRQRDGAKSGKKQQIATVPEDPNKVNWAQCDKCKKWRMLPSFVDMDSLPKKWYCYMNEWDAGHSKCSDPVQDDKSALLQQWRKPSGKLSYRDLIFGAWGGRLRSAAFSTNRNVATRESDTRFGRSSMFNLSREGAKKANKRRAKLARKGDAAAKLDEAAVARAASINVVEAEQSERSYRRRLLSILANSGGMTAAELARAFALRLADDGGDRSLLYTPFLCLQQTVARLQLLLRVGAVRSQGRRHANGPTQVLVYSVRPRSPAVSSATATKVEPGVAASGAGAGAGASAGTSSVPQATPPVPAMPIKCSKPWKLLPVVLTTENHKAAPVLLPPGVTPPAGGVVDGTTSVAGSLPSVPYLPA